MLNFEGYMGRCVCGYKNKISYYANFLLHIPQKMKFFRINLPMLQFGVDLDLRMITVQSQNFFVLTYLLCYNLELIWIFE